jgi:hypothetical protein
MQQVIVTSETKTDRTAKRSIIAAMAMILILAMAGPRAANAAEESSIQSDARPFGLDIASPVYASGSDENATTFMEYYSETLVPWVSTNLPEYTNNYTTSLRIDPSLLTLATDSDVRIYFIGEGAGYDNTLGFTSTTGDRSLIFPEASVNPSYNNATDLTKAAANVNFPLVPGDFVDLGSFEAGAQLDFFLIANGANGGTTTYSTDATTSLDGLTHAISWAPADSPYLLIGFEDLLGGGDGDFNDLLFAVAIQPLTTAPEPSTMLLLTSFLLVVLYLRHSSRFSPHSNPEQYPRIN